jgi:hypothetical protein
MRLDEYQIANALIDTRLVMTSRHGARIPDKIFIIDPNPVTSPRKPIHGLRDCVFLNFRVARQSPKGPYASAQSGLALRSVKQCASHQEALIRGFLDTPTKRQ